MAKKSTAAAPAVTTEAAPAAEVVQEQGAAGDTGAVESTDATTSTEAAPAAEVVQDQSATDGGAKDDVIDVQATAVASDQSPVFPRDVTIRNHGLLAICEPATRAYIGAGGSSVVAVQSKDQAVLLLSNIKSMHGADKIQVHGLDDIVPPDEDSEVT